MSIPKQYQIHRPILEFLAEHPDQEMEIAPEIARRMGLSEEEKAQTFSGSGENIYMNRLRWAMLYLKQAGLIDYKKRSHCRVTKDGIAYLKKHSGQIKPGHLRKNCSQFREWLEEMKQRRHERKTQTGSGDPDNEQTDDSDEETTPEAKIDNAYGEINAALKDELLDAVLEQSPAFFERLVVKLLGAMGYGGGDKLAQAIGQAGDGGIDGIIHQDILGLDVIYLQAKRYKRGNDVGSATIRNFIGSLSIKNAQKGVFITTSAYTRDARKTLEEASQNIVAIDGDGLVKHMIRYGVGVREQQTITLYKIDGDFFDEV